MGFCNPWILKHFVAVNKSNLAKFELTKDESFSCWRFKYISVAQARNQKGRKGGEAPPRKIFTPLGKMCWTYFKATGDSLKNIFLLSENSSPPLVSQAGYGPGVASQSHNNAILEMRIIFFYVKWCHKRYSFHLTTHCFSLFHWKPVLLRVAYHVTLAFPF